MNPRLSETSWFADQSPTLSAFRMLLRTMGLLRRVMDPYFARFGISGAQWGILRALHRAQENGRTPLRLIDLSGSLLVRPPSVTSAVSRLRRMQLVTLEPSPTDQRVKHIRLTPAGQRLVDRVLEGHVQQIERLMEVLDEKEKMILSDLLGRVSIHLESMASMQAGNSVGLAGSPSPSKAADENRG